MHCFSNRTFTGKNKIYFFNKNYGEINLDLYNRKTKIIFK